MTFEEAVKLAQQKLLSPGYKPEDYFVVGEKYPIRVAKIILEEAKHILHIEDLKINHPKLYKYISEKHEQFNY